MISDGAKISGRLRESWQQFAAGPGKMLFRIVVPIVMILVIYFSGRSELKMIDIGHTFLILQNLPTWMASSLFLAGLAAVATITLYDLVIMRALHLSIGWKKVMQTAWIASTFNNFLGFAGLTGPAVRILLYRSQGIETKDILQLTVLLVTSALTGLAGLAAAVSVGLLDGRIAFQVYPSLRWVVAAVAAYLPIFLLAQAWPWLAHKLNMGMEIRPRFIGALISVSHLQWLSAGTFFWLVNQLLGSHLTLAQGLGIYTVGVVVGVLSLTPGGIGSMDLVLLIFLQRFGITANNALTVVLLFRLNYFLFPWIIGLILSAVSFLSMPTREEIAGAELEDLPEDFAWWKKAWDWPGQVHFIGDLAVIGLTALVFLSGLILLIAAATPAVPPRLLLMYQLFSPLIRLSHHLSVGVGILLIVLSRWIRLKVYRAYTVVLYLLCFGALFMISKGMNYREAIFLVVVAVLLWLSRHHFDRNNLPQALGNLFFWLTLTTIIVFFYSELGAAISLHLADLPVPDLVEDIFVIPEAEIRRGALRSLIISWLLFGLWLVVKPPHIKRK